MSLSYQRELLLFNLADCHNELGVYLCSETEETHRQPEHGFSNLEFDDCSLCLETMDNFVKNCKNLRQFSFHGSYFEGDDRANEVIDMIDTLSRVAGHSLESLNITGGDELGGKYADENHPLLGLKKFQNLKHVNMDPRFFLTGETQCSECIFGLDDDDLCDHYPLPSPLTDLPKSVETFKLSVLMPNRWGSETLECLGQLKDEDQLPHLTRIEMNCEVAGNVFFVEACKLWGVALVQAK